MLREHAVDESETHESEAIPDSTLPSGRDFDRLVASRAHADLFGRPLGRQPADANGAPSFYPTQLQQAYGLGTLQGRSRHAGTANNGAGQTIAIIDAYHYQQRRLVDC